MLYFSKEKLEFELEQNIFFSSTLTLNYFISEEQIKPFNCKDNKYNDSLNVNFNNEEIKTLKLKQENDLVYLTYILNISDNSEIAFERIIKLMKNILNR